MTTATLSNNLIKIEKVAIEHANYLIREAGYNMWGYKKTQEMVNRIIKRHQEQNTSEQELDKLLAKYEELKKL